MPALNKLLSGFALLATLGLAGCGGGDSSTSNNAGQPVSAAESALGADNLPPGSADSSVSGLAASDLPPSAGGSVAGADLPPS